MDKIIKSKIFVAIIAITLLIVGYFAIDSYMVNKKYESDVKRATTNYEQASIEFLKSSLSLYYLEHNRYPLDIGDLTKYLGEINRQTDLLTQIPTKLKDFEYKTKGDYQAAQVSYTDFGGVKKVVEINYKNDFK
jgi:hypothetical protein